MYDPCKVCYLYPNACPTMCVEKHKHLAECYEDTQIVRKMKTKNTNVWYEHGKKYEMGKNGIRREICR